MDEGQRIPNSNETLVYRDRIEITHLHQLSKKIGIKRPLLLWRISHLKKAGIINSPSQNNY